MRSLMSALLRVSHVPVPGREYRIRNRGCGLAVGAGPASLRAASGTRVLAARRPADQAACRVDEFSIELGISHKQLYKPNHEPSAVRWGFSGFVTAKRFRSAAGSPINRALTTIARVRRARRARAVPWREKTGIPQERIASTMNESVTWCTPDIVRVTYQPAAGIWSLAIQSFTSGHLEQPAD